MKIFFTTHLSFRCIYGFVLLISIAVLFNSCKDEPQIWKVDSEDQVIGDYITSNPDEYSEFEKLVDLAGMNSLLKIRGPYTVFLPTTKRCLIITALKG